MGEHARSVVVSLGGVLAIVALVLAILLVVGVVPFGPQTVGGLVILLALARLS